MRKFTMCLLTIVTLISVTACTDHDDVSKRGNYNQSNNTSGQNNHQSGASNQGDSAYNLDDLIVAVKKAGCISGEAKTVDVKDTGAEKGLVYGNIMFLQYDVSSSNAYFDAYDANQVIMNGKAYKIGAINGPYFMIFLDGKEDQKAVKAFYSIGYGN